MTVILLTRARLLGTDHLVDLHLGDGLITRIVPSGTSSGPSTVAGAGEAPGRGPEVVDLDGRWVVPGLWDAHTHLEQWALVRRRLDVSSATSAAHAVRLVREALDARASGGPGSSGDDDGAGEPLVGFGLHWATWPEAPAADLLDGAGDVPVVLISFDLHSAWVNTAGLRHLGIDHPTGLLLEDEMLPAEQIDHPAGPDLDRLVRSAARAAAERGVVGVVDFGSDDNVTAWRRRAAGWDGLRVRAGVWHRDLEAALADGLRTGDRLGGSPLVELGSLKVISDGSLNSRTACCFDPYGVPAAAAGSGAGQAPGVVVHGPDDAARGVLNLPAGELRRLMARATDAGLTCAIHAIGDRANALALDAFERTGARGSIEHAQLVRWDDVARFAALGVTASVQPEHAMDDRDVAEVLWPARTDRAFPLARLAAAGVTLTLGSDAPVAPLDPWHAIASAVTRTRGGRDPWHAEQALSFGQALAASSGGHGITPRTGGRADLAILDADLPQVAPADPAVPGAARTRGAAGPGHPGDTADPAALSERLRGMPVAGTLLAGEWTHRSL
ncbi:amidohydrolase [Myceligenerans crystallogenes]|uniref:Amidohydrolase family protein n=1 Tax=Myceligenerans crystallogenes TaxID=316335 RepID=A0ABN2NDS9_9MICO